jgi:hypothetical protein
MLNAATYFIHVVEIIVLSKELMHSLIHDIKLTETTKLDFYIPFCDIRARGSAESISYEVMYEFLVTVSSEW